MGHGSPRQPAPVKAARGMPLHLCLCHGCKLTLQLAAEADEPAQCPRCGSPLHWRKANSLQRSWAFLLAALVCYIPANLYPVMNTLFLGRQSDNTIIGGITEFWISGDYLTALVIFAASGVIPCLKFVAMIFLLLSARRPNLHRMQDRTLLYRLLEWIGHWSMLDVIVVAIVAALVRFQALSTIEPRIGIAFFGASVVFTMLSAQHFDSRFIWDTPHDHPRTE
jgi:paraquat-inducible protein A